jgi:hypothetical protein
MPLQFIQKFDTLFTALTLATASLIGSMTSVAAQENLPVCELPRPGEYLLLVVSPTADSYKQLRNALPNQIPATTCRYLTNTVTRIGGFQKIDDANRWARYVKNIAGLSTIISTRTAAGDVVSDPVQPPPTPPRTVSFNPQLLGDGYAVLVDYFNRPELATSIQQLVGGNIGFASYGQRPYLLAAHTGNLQEAYRKLQKLNQSGFFAILVDGNKVMLLRSSVPL